MPTGLGNLLGMMGPPSAEHPVTMMSPSRRLRGMIPGVGPGTVGKFELGDLLEHVLLDPLMLAGMAGGVGMAASRKGGKWINKALGKVHRAEPFLDRRLVDKLAPVVSEQALSGADMLKARGMAEAGGRIPEAGIEAGLRGMDIPVGAESSALRASLETPGIGGAGSTWRMLQPGEAMPPSMSVGVDVSSPPRSFLARLMRRATGVGVSRDTADPAVRDKFAQQGGRVHGVMDRTKMVDVRQPGVLG